MNNVINFLLILTLVFLVYTNSNIGVMLAVQGLEHVMMNQKDWEKHYVSTTG